MAATAQNIWRIPAYLPDLQPSQTDEVIVAAEKQIGHPLPREDLDLLRGQNGGVIRYKLNYANEQIAGIGPNLPSLTNFPWDDYEEHVSFPLHGLYPFDGDGHWNLCLDYRNTPKCPVITCVDTEADTQSHIADSFAHYLSM